MPQFFSNEDKDSLLYFIYKNNKIVNWVYKQDGNKDFQVRQNSDEYSLNNLITLAPEQKGLGLSIEQIYSTIKNSILELDGKIIENSIQNIRNIENFSNFEKMVLYDSAILLQKDILPLIDGFTEQEKEKIREFEKNAPLYVSEEMQEVANTIVEAAKRTNTLNRLNEIVMEDTYNFEQKYKEDAIPQHTKYLGFEEAYNTITNTNFATIFKNTLEREIEIEREREAERAAEREKTSHKKGHILQ